MRPILACCAFLLLAAAAQAQLTIRIDAPALDFAIAQQCYLPRPLPVDVILLNAADTALPVATVRIKLIAPMALDTSEHSVTIKGPGTVGRHDSLKLRWLLVHPVVLTSSNQRVEIWARSGSDSITQARIIPIPAAAGATFNLFVNALPPLAPLPDSSGYAANPFPVIARFTNTGETPADSVRVALALPPDCVLDPPTQPNPVALATLQPLPLGDPRLDLTWTVRYTGATRAARSDSLVVTATGRTIAGGAVAARMARPLAIEGLAPRYAIDIAAPASVAYDTGTVYAPNPVPVTVTVRNTGAQKAVLPALAFSIAGSGASTQQPLARSPGTLEPGDSVSFSWDIALVREPAPRTIEFRAAVTDLDGVERSATAATAVPGQPWTLEVVDLSLPDTLTRNPAGTDYATRSFTVSYRVRNNSWMNTTLTALRLNYAAPDITPLAPIQHLPALPLAAGEVSPVYTDTFTVAGRSTPRNVTFTVTACSTGPDTGSAQRALYIPGLLPVLAIERAGVTALTIDTSHAYAPNPFEQTIRVTNAGTYQIRVDSIVLYGATDGVNTSDQRARHLAARIPPSASLEERWVFRAQPADTPRTLLLTAHAYAEGIRHEQASFTVAIPGMAAELAASPIGDEQLALDSAAIYRPMPFERGLMLRNTGPVDLRVDSVVVDFTDSLTALAGPYRHPMGILLHPGDSVSDAFRFFPEPRQTETNLSFTFTIHYNDTAVLRAAAATYIPGGPDDFGIATVSAPSIIAIASDSSYTPNPFPASCEVENGAWYSQTLESTELRLEGEGVALLTPAVQLASRWLMAYEHVRRQDSVLVEPRTTDRTVRLTYSAVSSRGRRDSATRTVFIPALPVTGVSPAAQPSAFSIEVYPQPLRAGNGLIIRVEMPEAADLRLELYTLLGARVALLHDGPLPPGHCEMRWSSAGLRPGVYFLAARSGSGTAARAVVIGR